MDSSALTFALDELTRAVVTGFGLLGDDARAVLTMAATLSYSLALALWLFEGRARVHGPLIRMIIKFAAIGWLLEWFPEGSAALMQAAVEQGQDLVPMEGFSLEDPGAIARLGLSAASPLMWRVEEMLGPVDFFLNFLEIVLFLLAALIVLVSFAVLAIQVFLAFLEFRILSLAAYLAIPFAVLGPTSFVAERAIGYVAASALKLLVLGLMITLAGGMLLTIEFVGDASLDQALGVALLSVAIFLLAVKAPRAAAGLINGGPIMDGASAMVALWVAARAGAMATGSLAGGAAAGLSSLRMGSGAGSSGATGPAAIMSALGPGGAAGGSAGMSGAATAPGAAARAAQGWDRPMTDAQRRELDRLAQGRSYDPGLSRGQASLLIQAWGGERSWVNGGGSQDAAAPAAAKAPPPSPDRETGP
ncbi:type IV secretion system protein [Rhodocista pekingensis]|uniref:Type IV secretion system protein n=1 Tax=Rhodocista pekingensis TaxID=201185 RepID=A0ABW2KV19_9PROT